MTVYLTLQDLKRLIVDLESVANNALTPSQKYPMTATINIGATKTNTKDKTRLCLFLDLLDKHGEIWCSGVWNLENKEQETIRSNLRVLLLVLSKKPILTEIRWGMWNFIS
ncbi:hypothetical protein BB390_06915 [Helicobacter pylori]|uniref:hypothetical protein n=1 Tax=Helicobacter pylori TaxID=210 RepID=UPI000BE9B7FC|nr:hypothetical protein [Helicobacter pylori]PDW12440.1 hypothetical protein BB390_06915 [Helicobacter pylori]